MSYLKACIMGGVDGVITSFAVVAAGSLTEDATTTVSVVGFASVVADGFSMGISEYLSSSGEHTVTKRKGSPILLGMLCSIFFIVCGSIPIIIFLVARQKLLACTAFSLVELMILGSGQTYVTKEPILFGLGRTVLLGSIAGVAAYGVGYMASEIEK